MYKYTVADLAGLDENQLQEVSSMAGGSAATFFEPESLESAASARTVIMNWGDERLAEVFRIATQQSGYMYGAEQLKVVAVVGEWALSLDVVPVIPVDPEAVTAYSGEVIPELLALADPEMNADNVFYSWDAEGAARLQRLYFERPQATHFPWVEEVAGYQMRFAWGVPLNRSTQTL